MALLAGVSFGCLPDLTSASWGDAGLVREWEGICKTAKLNPEMVLVCSNGPPAVPTVERRALAGWPGCRRAATGADPGALWRPMTLHLKKRTACDLGEQHEGCCPGACGTSAQLTLKY